MGASICEKKGKWDIKYSTLGPTRLFNLYISLSKKNKVILQKMQKMPPKDNHRFAVGRHVQFWSNNFGSASERVNSVVVVTPEFQRLGSIPVGFQCWLKNLPR